jgi:hypothetical protein
MHTYIQDENNWLDQLDTYIHTYIHAYVQDENNWLDQLDTVTRRRLEHRQSFTDTNDDNFEKIDKEN